MTNEPAQDQRSEGLSMLRREVTAAQSEQARLREEMATLRRQVAEQDHRLQRELTTQKYELLGDTRTEMSTLRTDLYKQRRELSDEARKESSSQYGLTLFYAAIAVLWSVMITLMIIERTVG